MAYMRRTLDSVIAQTVRPALWVIVDDGSTDDTPQILADYTARHDWIRVVPKPDRGHRAVGPGVIEAFYAGLATIDLGDFDYLCKLDLDLDLPVGYFAS
jgi:biofilm PGA synthesis N-glycosyltransferase PgaC